MYRCVMSVHGIRTRGVWQKDLAPVLALRNFVPFALDYGWFSTFSFASRRARDRKVEWLRGEYERVTAEANVQRPSIIAHSFGTYLVAGLLLKYQQIRFDKVILAGSIVDRDFDWPSVIDAGQVNWLRNDYGTLDRWPRLARSLVPDAGPSGAEGFRRGHRSVSQRRFPRHRHSDYFHRGHFQRYWIPTLMRVVVSAHERSRLTDMLDLACQTVASRLAVPVTSVRANIFMPDEEGTLGIPDGLTHNMPEPQEHTISITPGTGCTGVAFSQREQTIAIMRGGWGTHTLPGTELAKVHKGLKWIVSTPIPDPDLAGAVLGIFNVDGLDVEKGRDALEPLLGDLSTTAKSLAVTFKKLA